MPYLNVDDGMDEHPKVEALSDAAFRMHMSGMLYAARRGTDGVISRQKARRLSDTSSDAIAAELVRSGVWHDLGEGCGSSTCLAGVTGAYVIHDYLQWNHSKDWWDKRRRDETERKKKYRARKSGGAVDGDAPVPAPVPVGQTPGHHGGRDEPEPEPEPEPIPASHRPALADPSRRGTTDRAREGAGPWMENTA